MCIREVRFGFGIEQGSGSVNNGYNYRYKRSGRTERISVQVSTREKQKLEELAKAKGQTVSEYIRQICIYKPWEELFNE